MTYINRQKYEFAQLSEELFAKLDGRENASLRLAAEDSLFVRFNNGRVRQNTLVEQSYVSLELHREGRTVTRRWTLTGDATQDTQRGLKELAAARITAEEIATDAFQVPMENHGTSEKDHQGTWPSVSELINEVAASAQQGLDLAGLLCTGDIISATRNSKGQSHWFSSKSFFLDYSLFNAEKAAKGLYAGRDWKSDEWRKNLAWTRTQLELLHRPLQTVKPGQYRTYLAPAAASEYIGMLGWGALSYSTWKQGSNPFKKFIDGGVKLSPLLSLSENFDLGLTPAFNGRGEVSKNQIPLIEKGALRSLLISSRAAKEYSTAGNAASEYETPRSLEVANGTLAQENILRELGTGLYLSNLHYLNWSDRMSARATGMTRYACFWVESGEMKGPIKDLRFDESYFDALGPKLRAVTSFSEIHPDTGTYGSRSLGGSRTPGMLIDDFSFTL